LIDARKTGSTAAVTPKVEQLITDFVEMGDQMAAILDPSTNKGVRDRLSALKAKQSARFDELCDRMAAERGLGGRSSLTPDQVDEVTKAAEDAIEK
jgi:hypothetical protein